MLAGSVTGGAASLHISAPAVSRMLSHLEQRLGVRLFERRGSHMVPTPEALALMREVDTAYGHIDRVRQMASALRHGLGVRLRLCSNLSTALELVPRAIARLRRSHADLQLSVDVAPLARICQGLDAGEFDLGIAAFIDLEPAGLQCHVVGSGELRVVMPRDHALATMPEVPTGALRDVELVAYGPGDMHGRQLDKRLGREPGEPSVQVHHAYMACAMVACGEGVAVVDDLTLRHFHGADIVSRPLRPSQPYRVELLLNPNRPQAAAVQPLLTALRDAWSELHIDPSPMADP